MHNEITLESLLQLEMEAEDAAPLPSRPRLAGPELACPGLGLPQEQGLPSARRSAEKTRPDSRLLRKEVFWKERRRLG